MEKILLEELPKLFESVAAIFAEKKEELCEMDANMGDGDLGLTMNKGYSALPDIIRENTEPDNIGKTLFKSGMKMSTVVPSTMGTLMSSGIMEGGKTLNNKTEIGAAELAGFINGFAAGIKKRGKCEPGDRTILDAILAAADKAEAAAEAGSDMLTVIKEALAGAAEGVEATRDMIPKYGKAAVFAAKAKGIADQGAVAGYYLIKGIADYIEKN